MGIHEPIGCLGGILRLLGIDLSSRTPAGAQELPYRLRDDFLSAAELSFFRVLASVVQNKAVICPKVRLADVFFVAQPHQNQSYRNKIDRKHVDFLLCDPLTLKPLLGVELDDSSHARSTRQERDPFVDDVFEVAGLPLLRVPARSTYSPNELLGLIAPHFSDHAHSPPQQRISETAHVPLCSKCGMPMVRRVSSKGQHAGQSFWGCPNYPKCRLIVSD
ncbi:DUF2726 domain-containing protein [Planctomicrobium sp. SH527]|uniref:DUF2726 domain-containing protein n=1 Tax=Planctomicrobium sp. SH527 TaxID=3448123 RepID=UPI003F5B9653